MKLSKQERIGLLIIIAVVVIALGGFLMVKPKVEDAFRNKETMETTQKDYNEKKAKADTKEPLREQILSAYKEGVEKADMFFTDMKGYETDDMFREFLENRKSTKSDDPSKANVLIEELEIGASSTASLSAYFPEEETISYPLKEFATQGGVTLSEKEQASLERKAKLQSFLGGDQEIGCKTIDLTIKAISQDEMIKFADEINNFIRKENNKDVRKAMMLSGISVTYPLITNQYDEMADKIAKESKEAGQKALVENAGITLKDTDSSSSSNTSEDDDKKKGTISDYLFSWDTTLIFYSVERMQDPTPILDAQDGK